MGLSFDADGSQIADGTEQDLFAAQTTLATYWCKVSCHNMASGDVVRIRTYVKDENSATTRVLYDDRVSYSHIKTDPVYYIPPIPTNSFKVSIEQTDGTNRTFTWLRGTY